MTVYTKFREALIIARKDMKGRFMAVLLLSGILAGCDNYLDIDLPSSQLTADAVFEDQSTATAALMNVYATIRNSGMLSGTASGVSAEMGLYADELQYYGTSSYFAVDFFNNNLLPSQPHVATWWASGYTQIYAANAVIEGVAASQALTQPVRDQLTGEALFLRALVHFYLENLYGDMPYITTTDYIANNTVSRMPSQQVYSNIIADLELAIALLPESYTGQGRVRANKDVVRALLARAYLYDGQWAAAADMASTLINNTAAYVLQPLEVAYFKDSASAIWQFAPSQIGLNTEEGATFIFEQGPPPFAALRSEFLASFEPGDQRKLAWVREITGEGTTWSHVNKYKERTSTGESVEYSIVLGLPEQYLIRAEARAMQGELVSAAEDLNAIRARAGLGETGASGQQQLLDAIAHERRVELFTEFGHRFFDLKRTGKLDAALGGLKPGWQATDKRLPIPEAQILLNPNLNPQNDGY